jgi:hypothetical protein
MIQVGQQSGMGLRHGVWQRAGIVVTALWLLAYSVIAYLGLSSAKAEQLRYAGQYCRADQQSCLSDWVSMSEIGILAMSFGIAAGAAVAFWAVVAVCVVAVRWVLAGRRSR